MATTDVSVFRIYDTYIENLETEECGGGIFVNKSVFIIENHVHISHCIALQTGGGSFFDNINYFSAHCTTLSNNVARLNPATLYNMENSTFPGHPSFVNHSSFCFHSQTEEHDQEKGSPVSFYSGNVLGSSNNNSCNVVSHISAIQIYGGKSCIIQYNNIYNCTSLDHCVIFQAQNCPDSQTLTKSNIIKNDNKDDNKDLKYGIIRSYYCDTNVSYCFIKDNKAKYIFSTENCNINVMYCNIDVSDFSFPSVIITHSSSFPEYQISLKCISTEQKTCIQKHTPCKINIVHFILLGIYKANK